MKPSAPLPIDPEILRPYARYIWWKTPDEALAWPRRLIAQVMNFNVNDDVAALATTLGDDVLRNVVRHAEAGWFDEHTWTYWHYRLHLCEVDQVPPLPVRTFT